MEKAIRRKAARIKQSVEEVVDAVESEDERNEIDLTGPIDRSMLIPTGSTLLNLALSDDPYGGFALGTINNIIGDSAAGKCVKNAYVLSSKGMHLLDKEFPDHKKGVLLAPYKNNFATEKGVSKETTDFYSEYVDKTIKVTTRHGYNLEGTKNHPVLIWTKECTLVMKKLKDVKEGDVAIIAGNTQSFTNKSPSLKKYIPKTPVSNHAIRPHFPLTVTEDFALLLGYIVANGTLGVCNDIPYVSLSSTKNWFKSNADRVLESYGVKWNMHDNGKNGFIGGRLFAQFIHNIFGESHLTAHFKKVPECILTAPKRLQASFLKGLIDCDGFSAKGGSQLDFYTSSNVLAEQVHLMLLNFGIIANRNVKYKAVIKEKVYEHDYFTISIYGSDTLSYSLQIGSDKYDFSYIKNKVDIDKRCNTYDTIPYLKSKLKQIREDIRHKVGWSANGNTKGKTKMPRVKSFCSNNNNLSFKSLNVFLALFERYKNLFDFDYYKFIADSSYHFDPIYKKEVIGKRTRVCDVVIPDGHRFWTNGFISHNTFLLWTMFAELTYDKRFNEHELIYDEPEAAFAFNTSKLFGQAVEDRVVIDTVSDSVESWHDNVFDKAKEGHPFIYGLDSLDAISSEEEIERDIRKGTFGAAKPKLIGEILRKIVQKVKGQKSAVFVISQTRDAIGVMFGDKKTRSGGKALKFFSSHEIWMAVKAHIKRKERDVGVHVRVKISKNKITGKLRIIEFPIYYDYGVDDITSCINFLTDEGHWAVTKNVVNTKGEITKELMKTEALASFIADAEHPDRYKKLIEITAKEWRKIEDSIGTKLPPKYKGD